MAHRARIPRIVLRALSSWDHPGILSMRDTSGASENPKRETTVESHPSKNEGWGTRPPAFIYFLKEWGCAIFME